MRKATKTNTLPDLKIIYPKIAAMYELLKPESSFALVYQGIYVVRRLILALIVVFMRESKVFQIFSMIVLNLAIISYIIKVQPFESPGLNRLEVFNEFIVLSCLYHLLMFSDGLNGSDHLLYNIGWSMDILLILQFCLNMIFFAYNFFVKIRLLARRFFFLQRLKMMQAQLEKQIAETNQPVLQAEDKEISSLGAS